MIKSLEVFISKRKVGTISLNKNNSVFQYDDKCITDDDMIQVAINNKIDIELAKEIIKKTRLVLDK